MEKGSKGQQAYKIIITLLYLKIHDIFKIQSNKKRSIYYILYIVPVHKKSNFKNCYNSIKKIIILFFKNHPIQLSNQWKSSMATIHITFTHNFQNNFYPQARQFFQVLPTQHSKFDPLLAICSRRPFVLIGILSSKAYCPINRDNSRDLKIDNFHVVND